MSEQPPAPAGTDKKAVKPTVADEDLDDLDDVLDEFSAGGSSKPAPPSASTAPTSTPSGSKADSSAAASSSKEAKAEDGDEDDEDPLDDPEINADFAKEFAAGMEALMRELGGADPGEGAEASKGAGAWAAPGAAGGGGGGPQVPNMSEEEMMRQFEAMMSEMGLGGMTGGAGPSGASALGGAGPSSSSSSAAAGPSSSTAAAPANFQDAIKATMTRLKESSDTASASSGAGAGGSGIPGLDGMTDGDIEKILASLGAGGVGAEGLDGEEGLAKMLENMMGELMSKEVLHEPLKELRDKYPEYLSSDKGKSLPESDRARYEKQHQLVSEIVKTFELKEFDEGSEARKSELKKKVADLMSEMQDTGAPPDEIVGELPPELGNMPGMGGSGAPGEEQCCVM